MKNTENYSKLSLAEFLNYFDFSYEIRNDRFFSLVDLQHANLTNIEEEKCELNYTGITHCIDRLDTYIYDYTIRLLNESTKINFSFDNVQSAVQFKEKSDANKKSVAQFCDIDILNAVINPNFIQINELT